MTSCDTNILFPACDASSPQHASARAFLDGHRQSGDFCLCEQVLLELYCLLRNPTVCRNPLPGSDAVGIIQSFRSNPAWRVVDVVLAGEIMQKVWQHASADTFAYRRVLDARLAETLRHHGITEFATCNAKDFAGFGFDRIWNPLV
ncbi:MAG: PIN domain-containing protein [Kiritimatiellia bacterium]|jgi:toxin-antitoxin system PIN domain toxin|nr:PIN domain-containing protein [Kiritimatiellia bacterium]MDP6811363.1 PIN domain-containing protein [Kiritimatiellia bacterium]MDP7024404.1 PIN domain-containing protein [Kiritimatiellia bacterium]